MNESGESAADRRMIERRLGLRVSELTLPELRRVAITSMLFAIVLGLFIWMVRTVIIAAILGGIVAVYLRPVERWLTRRLGGNRWSAALITLTGILGPVVGVVLYSYLEILAVTRYLTRQEAEVVAAIEEAVQRLPGLDFSEVEKSVRRLMTGVSRLAEDLPGEVGEAAGSFSIAATIFLLTAFYVLTRGEELAAELRARIPPRYEELVGALESNARGVLYGTIYAMLVTQALKSVVVLLLNLIFAVPLAAVLAVLSFVIGFFPLVGSWTVYVPVAGWLLMFRDNLPGALVVLGVGLLCNTVFISSYLRPKLAADRSQVLDFYWMFVGLVTGVYTFGLAGVVLGPIVIGLLKAIFDTVTTQSSWRLIEEE